MTPITSSNPIGTILSIQIRKEKKGHREFLKQSRLIKAFGLEGDGHSGSGPRQVSMLSIESIQNQPNCPKFRKQGDHPGPGEFSENITTEGAVLSELRVGDQMRLGQETTLRITEKGRVCRQYCAVYKQEGGCPVPEDSLFAEVIKGGDIEVGDAIVILKSINEN